MPRPLPASGTDGEILPQEAIKSLEGVTEHAFPECQKCGVFSVTKRFLKYYLIRESSRCAVSYKNRVRQCSQKKEYWCTHSSVSPSWLSVKTPQHSKGTGSIPHLLNQSLWQRLWNPPPPRPFTKASPCDSDDQLGWFAKCWYRKTIKWDVFKNWLALACSK